MIDTFNKLLKFQYLNNGFHYLELKSNWLSNDKTLIIELFYSNHLYLTPKQSKLLENLLSFEIRGGLFKSLCREINTFSFNNAKVPPLSSKSSTVNSFNCLQPAKLSSNSNFSHFTRKSFAESVLKSNNSLFSLGTFSTQSSCFIPSAYKFSVASVPVKNVSSF